MDMNDTTLTPAGDSSLRPVAGQQAAEPVGRFTVTRPVDPSEIWQPHSRKIAPPDRPIVSRDAYKDAPGERPVARELAGADGALSFHDVARSARSAVRPGAFVGAP